jgi:hypothetical protein
LRDDVPRLKADAPESGLETRLHERGRSTPLTVVHCCGHLQAYPVPGRLDDEGRWRVSSQLAQKPCLCCILKEAWRELPLTAAALSPAA